MKASDRRTIKECIRPKEGDLLTTGSRPGRRGSMASAGMATTAGADRERQG